MCFDPLPHLLPDPHHVHPPNLMSYFFNLLNANSDSPIFKYLLKDPFIIKYIVPAYMNKRS